MFSEWTDEWITRIPQLLRNSEPFPDDLSILMSSAGIERNLTSGGINYSQTITQPTTSMLQGLQKPGGWGTAGRCCVAVIVTNIYQVLGSWVLLRTLCVLTCFRSQTPQVHDIVILTYSCGIVVPAMLYRSWEPLSYLLWPPFLYQSLVLGLSSVI